MISKKLKKFLQNEENQDLINEDTKESWKQIYRKLPIDIIGEFTKIILECGINDPAEIMGYIPTHYLDRSNIDSYKIPGNIISIDPYTLSDCKLTNITVDATNPVYKDIDGNLYSKDGKTLIQYAIGKTATSFVIPNGVTSIGEGAFAYCDRLTSVVIGDSVTSIGDSAFVSCDSLTNVKIGNNVKSIGSSAFRYCSNLTKVKIGNNVKSIGSYAFNNCDSLTSIALPDSITLIDFNAFSYCDSLTDVTIGNNVTNINGWAFDDCDNLTEVRFNGTKKEAINCGVGDRQNEKWREYSPIKRIICTDGVIEL